TSGDGMISFRSAIRRGFGLLGTHSTTGQRDGRHGVDRPVSLGRGQGQRVRSHIAIIRMSALNVKSTGSAPWSTPRSFVNTAHAVTGALLTKLRSVEGRRYSARP